MKEEQIKSLLNDIFEKTFVKSYSSGGTYNNHVVDKEARLIVEQIIRSHLADNREEKIGILEAKVFMYEQIISKSNFAPMLPTKNKEEQC